MEINYKHLHDNNKIIAETKSGKPAGHIEYKESSEDTLTVLHTIVDKEYSGQGIARQLVDHIVTFARGEDKKIISECSYAKHIIEKNPEYHSIKYKE